MKILTTVAAAAVLACLTGASAFGQEDRPFGLADVRTIYVATFGSSEAAIRGREIMAEALRGVGFEIADEAEGADGALRSMVVTKSSRHEVWVEFKKVTLQAPSGDCLWKTSLGWGWRFRNGPLGTEPEDLSAPAGPTERQARGIARALRARVREAVHEVARELE